MKPLRNWLYTLCLLFSFDSRIQGNEFEDAQYKELDQYLDKQISAADQQRAKSWHRDFSSADAYEKSIEPWRAKLWNLIGGKPQTTLPLDPKEELIQEFPTHKAYRVWLQVLEGVHGYGILLVPKGQGPFPAMVCIHGMKSTPEYVCGLEEKPDYTRNFGLRAVQKGYVVFAPYDVNTQEGRRWLDRKAFLIGKKLQALEQFKVERAVDYLSQRPDVNPKKIGAYGISWGGRTVMYLGAVDKRIAASAISGHFNDHLPKMVTPSSNYTPFIQTAEDYAFFSGHFLLFNDADVVSLICPRPVFIEQGKADRVAHWEDSKRAFNEVKAYYDKLNLSDRAVYGLFEGVHEVRGDEAFEFFDKWLKH